MILESIVTTVDPSGQVNIAPMGPTVLSKGDPTSPVFKKDVDGFVLRPFKTSTTYANLIANPFATIHVTDDAFLFARAAVSNLSKIDQARLVHQLEGTQWWPLGDCHRWFAVQVSKVHDDELRVSMDCRVVDSSEVRPYFGFNRAKHAVIEAAILATRTHLLPVESVLSEIDRLQPLVDKTGGPDEHEGFDLLKATIHERYAGK